MDMTTCDRISASSLFIRSAIEATASEHSSWKGFNQIIEYAWLGAEGTKLEVRPVEF